MKRIIACLLVGFLIITAIGCGANKKQDEHNHSDGDDITPTTSGGYYTLNLKINPDVSFMVDENNQVIGIVTNNDDARDVYNNITFSSYDLDTAVNEWAAQCTKMGFNTHNMEVGICGSSENIESFGDTWQQLKKEYKVFNADDIQSIDVQTEIPVCEFCGKQLFDVYEKCPDCGHEVGYEVITCFCGATMATASKPCPVCHLYNLTGEYEEGWGPEGKTFLYCFCGAKCDSLTGICESCHLHNFTGEYDPGYEPVSQEPCRCFCGGANIDNATGICPACHLNNFTGAYEAGYEPVSQEKNRCFCGEAYIDNATGICPACHLNNYTGEYEEGYGGEPSGSVICFCGAAEIDPVTGICPVCHLNNTTGVVEPDANCSYCHGTGYMEDRWTCSGCGGDGQTHPTAADVCTFCGGTGICTIPDTGVTEFCGMCNGTGYGFSFIPGPCPACNGQGSGVNYVPCTHCWGK